MFKSKLSKVIVSLLRRIAGVTRSGAKRLMRAMLQALMAMGRRAKLPVAGFVLPTVTMVLLVVILLTVAIVLRSFDRANMARNVRVNQQVLAAATPALDRAKAKINFLLYEDPQRPTATPSDENLHGRIANSNAVGGAAPPDLYTFGDEERLILRADLSVPANNINPTDDPRRSIIIDPATNLENEAINTGWRYPVDTDNDGTPDTFTLYGIFFRTPARNAAGEFTRPRRPIEARTPPMSGNTTNPNCARGGGTVASLVGDSGWYKMDDGLLKKSFFVYTVNVPITAAEAGANQAFKGTTSISALEYQQDQSRVPLTNNAAVYEDDLDISPGPALDMNGGILTNSNLLVSGTDNAVAQPSIRLHQISSPESCFYSQLSSKITVGGNVVSGWSGNITPQNPVRVDLFRTRASLPAVGARTQAMVTASRNINPQNQSATGNNSLQVLYNNAAYAARLSMLVEARRGQNAPVDEDTEPVAADDPFSVRNKPASQTRKQALEEHFKQTLRKVPFNEVALGGNPTLGFSLPWKPPLPPETAGAFPLQGQGTDNLRPPDAWSIPNPAQTNIQVTPAQLEATDPSTKPEQEERLGDRVLVGNNLPALRWDAGDGKLVSKPELIQGATWTGSTEPRTRTPRVTKLADVGATARSGFWETEAAKVPVNPLDGNGGLRVITGAGVYERINSFLPPPTWQNPLSGATVDGAVIPTPTYDDPTTTTVTEAYPVVWPDTMPMSPLGPGSQVYNNNPASGALGWTALPGAPIGAAPFPPGGLTQAGLQLAAGSVIDPNTPQYAKGDLRMRATVVYHYDNNRTPAGTRNETPLACVSSYYDPSTASTARNLNLPGIPDVSGDTTLGVRGTQVGSNNGVVYTAAGIVGARAIGPLAPVNGLLPGGTPLANQANLVFPDGRFVNPLLRKALETAPAARSLAETAAVDSTNCALQILGGAAQDAGSIPNPTPNQAAIKEVAFLNAREVKAIDRDDWETPNVNEAFTLSSPLTNIGAARPANLTGNYNLPLEERQPLEIRATQIDLNLFRRTRIGAGEYLLPNSGIIYASRDDALPDLSARSVGAARIETVSPTDSLLDPTRKPNGILLVNGAQLARVPGIGANPSVSDVVREKGLTLVSNLPVYIQGDSQGFFNRHTQQEFTEVFNWATFYDRQTLNPNFACRQNDPRVRGCTTGDNWRPANVLSDAVTLLSSNYRFGFRNEGDFDLRNNAGAAAVIPRKQQGFYANNFVTNGLSSGAFSVNGGIPANPLANPPELGDTNYANANALRSSYFNNFVTPVQRRGRLPEYVMEVCTKLPVSACGDGDWYVNPAAAATAPNFGKANVGDNITSAANPYPAGTTANPPAPELQRFPRRVAFQRTYTPPLPSATAPTAFDLTTPAAPVPLGVSTANLVVADPSQARTTSNNSLWFGTTAAAGGGPLTYGVDDFPYVFNRSRLDSTGAVLPILAAVSSLPPAPAPPNGSQPLLIPVLQTQTVGPAARDNAVPTGGTTVQATGWIPQAVATTFNLIMGSNDTPSRALGNNFGDSNGGLQNLPRFLESWNINIPTNIQGSFIQFDRSRYSTAPYFPILPLGAPQQTNANTDLRSLFADTGITIPNPPPIPAGGPPRVAIANPPQRGYRTANGNMGGNLGRIPFFIAPTRNWGYDVGLVSQSPDLFAQKFTAPPSPSTPDEFFREVGRDDEWVKTLMCGVLENGGMNATSSRPGNCPP